MIRIMSITEKKDFVNNLPAVVARFRKLRFRGGLEVSPVSRFVLSTPVLVY